MSAARDELRRLIEDLPEEEVPAALADVRRYLAPAPSGTWPPPWFGAGAGERDDIARNHDDLLASGFGRS